MELVQEVQQFAHRYLKSNINAIRDTGGNPMVACGLRLSGGSRTFFGINRPSKLVPDYQVGVTPSGQARPGGELVQEALDMVEARLYRIVERLEQPVERRTKKLKQRSSAARVCRYTAQLQKKRFEDLRSERTRKAPDGLLNVLAGGLNAEAAGTHGRCAEPLAIIKALRAIIADGGDEKELVGATCVAIAIGVTKGSRKPGATNINFKDLMGITGETTDDKGRVRAVLGDATHKPACPSCRRLLRQFGIREIIF